ncbi:MAG: hypothetical protein EZS28_026498 [Streblomastix strix]|uniref:Uncharacterized protein n=1 Tax=Streblomastix strix TaxID=222440 RepID=A0A5J4V605_9EUKA|nr:MAG: hypothetical protein EZS28_026498 [Streblomastix strix]
MRILEALGWTIAQEKCEMEPKQQTNLLGYTWDLKRMYLKMADLRKKQLRFQLKRFISLTEKQVPIKIKYLASIIAKLNFLRVQVREASFNLNLMDFVRTRALKKKDRKLNKIFLKKILQELYLRLGVIVRNQEMTLEMRIQEAVMLSDASLKGWRVNLELQTGETLVQHGERNQEQKKWSSNKKEMEAIFLGLFRYRQVFKELQIKAILIKSDSSTAVQDLVKQRAGQTLVAEVKKIVKLCQQLKIQTQTQHIPGISNKITDSLSSLSSQRDYLVKKEKFKNLCKTKSITPTLELFATGENKLVDRYVATVEEEKETDWLNAFSKPSKEKIFWILPPILKIAKILIAWEMFYPKSIMIAPWWPGQIWFTSLLTGSSTYLFLRKSIQILNQRIEITTTKGLPLTGKITAFLVDQESNWRENCQLNFQLREHDQKNQSNDNRRSVDQHNKNIYIDNGSV